MAEPSFPPEDLTYEPGAVAPTPPPAPDPAPPRPPTQEVTLGGRTFEVTPDVAALIAAQADQLQQSQIHTEQLQQRVSEFDAWRQQAAQVFTGQQPQAQPDYGTLLYTDPNAAFARLREDIVGGMREMYQQDQAQRDQQANY